MLAQLLAAAAALLLAVLYRKLHYARFQQYAHFPQHAPSLLLGHLGVVDAFIRKEPPRGHADMAFTAMHEALGRPAVMLVDLRPVSSCMVIVCSHEVAEQVSRPTDRWPHTPPKGPEFWESMKPLAGPTSILAAHGEQWRALRKRFNPGFAPQHLMTLLPAILDKVSLCLGQLDTHARAGEEFSLQHIATNLTFDIIGRVVLDFGMDAQTATPTPFMRDFRALIETYTSDHLDLPWWCTPRTQLRRRQLSRRIRTTLRAMVRARHADAHGLRGASAGAGGRSILAMSLRDIGTLTPELVDVTCDQLSTFLFAGHDTTATLMAWAVYELARTPRALAAVRAELDELFGADSSPEAVRDRLLAPGGDELVHRMAYTSAVLKETLRLWPPGSTTRMTRPGDGWAVRDPSTGEMHNLDGLLVYQLVPIIQRDPRAFGDTANRFVPERWLHQEEDGDKAIPTGAWRAFERGPRNCIGQELATIEARVLIAMVARRYDFTKVGQGAVALDKAGEPELDGLGQYKVVSDMYQTREITSKPIDGIRMKVALV
ncbi:cytochrome P450 [Lasiosphaeria ovina]|uniref:Cytochrome P450 n=1 Tax=Lasiosphaeria ovina TaxID=92902 RepID=A0AAE0N3J5_9PEZI|nr:cytochrome P450 [Lasiosphaeria ovina]